jgi:XTP/dITP diphosphohydrolase
VITLYLATSNPGKQREFQEAAHGMGITVACVPNFQQLPPCVEDGATFEENARKKAQHYSQFCGGWVFADDSGISVDALGGAPGVHSARFAGPGATDEANNAKLLDLLRLYTATGERERTARYTCVIALAERGKVLAVTEGSATGVILPAPRGSGGFGYDPLFFYPPLGKTFAELGPGEKWAVSHRGIAFRRLVEWMRQAPVQHA